LTADIDKHSVISPDHQLSAHAPAPPRYKKVVRVVIWILSLLVVALVLVLLLRYHEDAKKVGPAPAKITVTTTTAQKGDIGVYIDAIGTVTPVYTTSISSQVNGRIVTVNSSGAASTESISSDTCVETGIPGKSI